MGRPNPSILLLLQRRRKKGRIGILSLPVSLVMPPSLFACELLGCWLMCRSPKRATQFTSLFFSFGVIGAGGRGGAAVSPMRRRRRRRRRCDRDSWQISTVSKKTDGSAVGNRLNSQGKRCHPKILYSSLFAFKMPSKCGSSFQFSVTSKPQAGLGKFGELGHMLRTLAFSVWDATIT